MDGGFLLPVEVECVASPRIERLCAAAHLGALGGALAAAMPTWAKAAAAVLLILSLAFRLVRWRDERRRAPARLCLNARDEWRLIAPDGFIEELSPLPPHFVYPWLVVLRFASPRGRRTVVLTADNTRADELRRLRVRLRYPQGAGDPGVTR